MRRGYHLPRSLRQCGHRNYAVLVYPWYRITGGVKVQGDNIAGSIDISSRMLDASMLETRRMEGGCELEDLGRSG